MKTSRRLHYLILAASVIFNAGCYEELQSTGSSAYTPAYIAPEDFLGVESVSNLTTGLSIVWQPANPAKNINGYRIYRYEVNEPQLIATVAPNVTSYIDGSVISGNNYSYRVRAVDAGNAEDTNNVKITGIFWEGLTSVTSSDQSKIRVTFSPQLKGYNLKIYLTGEGRAQDKNIATISSDAAFSLGYYDITRWSDGSSLKPGATYQVGAEIFESNNLTLSDGNRTLFDVNTLSYGFDPISSQQQGWNNVATVRAFGESPLSELMSTGAANAYNIDTTSTINFVAPKKAQVEIGFIPFSLPAGLDPESYRYKVIRAPEGEVFNSSTLSVLCPETFTDAAVSPTVSSLEPCILNQDIHPVDDLENGLVVIRDQSVWDSIPSSDYVDTTLKPPRYRYFMTLQHLNDATDISLGTFTEEIPQASFTTYSVLVPVPPANMTLVNRESVNYEFCKVQQSKPTDPLKNNRCEHYEVGNNTFNSGPGNAFLDLSSSYYDFGYNLFVDRYPLACNNTLQSSDSTTTTILATAVSHSAASVLDLTGAAETPTENDVLYSLLQGTGPSTLVNGGMSNCRLYNNGAWMQLSDFTARFTSTTTPSITSAFQTTLTSAPRTEGTAKFNYPNWSQSTAQAACNSFSGSGYGLKRIPRIREFRAFTAPPFEISVDGKNLKDFYAQAINSAVSKDQTNWTDGSCLRTSVSGTALKTKVFGKISGLNYPSPSELFTGSNPSKLSVLNDGNLISFMLGASADALCMSKYGINGVVETAANYNGGSEILNPIANGLYSARYPTSDLFSWNPTATSSVSGTLTGLINNNDQGNNDLSLNIVGVSTGYFIGMPTTVSHLTTSTFNTNIRFDQALGLPAVSADSLNLANYTPSITASANYLLTPLMVPPSGYSSTTPVAPQVSSRYTTSFDNILNRVRCVISAD